MRQAILAKTKYKEWLEAGEQLSSCLDVSDPVVKLYSSDRSAKNTINRSLQTTRGWSYTTICCGTAAMFSYNSL